MARLNLIPYTFVWENGKTMDFSDTIVFHDINVGRLSQLNEYMNRYEYQRSGSFIDIGPNHSDSIFFNWYSMCSYMCSACLILGFHSWFRLSLSL